MKNILLMSVLLALGAGVMAEESAPDFNTLLMRATVLTGSSAYHWRVVRPWIRLSTLFTDFRDGRVPK